jgi:hypothetical protein
VGAILFINDDDEKLRKIFEKVLSEHGQSFENNAYLLNKFGE